MSQLNKLDIPTLIMKSSYITIFEAMEKGLLDLKPKNLTNSIREVLRLPVLQRKIYTSIDLIGRLTGDNNDNRND